MRCPIKISYAPFNMKYSIALVSLILVSSSSGAGAIGYIQPPPARYDKPAFNVSVQYASKSQIKRYCGNPFALGCAYAHSKGCTIIVPLDTGTGSMLYRHERAHCNGWPKNHPW
jgi:hypothetical protein